MGLLPLFSLEVILRYIRVEFSATVSDDTKDMRIIQELMKAVDIASDGTCDNMSNVSIVKDDTVFINVDRKSFWEMVDSVSYIRGMLESEDNGPNLRQS